MEHKNKEKNGRNTTGADTEPKNGLTLTKGKGTGEDGWEGRGKGGEKGKGAL